MAIQERYYILSRKGRFYVRKNGKNQYITTSKIGEAKIFEYLEDILEIEGIYNDFKLIQISISIWNH